MVSIWIRGSVLTNPYYHTAFRVARVPREVVRHRTIVQLIGQTRQLLQTNPDAHATGGEPVRPADVNAAERILLDPVARMAEELLEHAAEKPPVERVRKLFRELGSAMAVEESGLPARLNWKSLELVATGWVAEFLATQSAPDPSFGALELNTPPPFGREEEQSA